MDLSLLSQAMPGALLGGGLEPATVVAVRGGRAELTSARFGRASARLAVAATLRAGDQVLVGASIDGTVYVVGVLGGVRELALDDGSSARVETEDGEEALRVFDPRGKLVFERRADRTVVHVPDGDLTLEAAGDIALRAGGEVRLDAAQRASVTSAGPVKLRSGESSVVLDGAETRVATGRLVATAEVLESKLGEARVVVGTLRTVADRIRERAGTVERTADRVIEKMKESFRDVEGASHTRAGSVRMVAREALSFVAKTALLRAKEDVKIRGEKIFLA